MRKHLFYVLYMNAITDFVHFDGELQDVSILHSVGHRDTEPRCERHIWESRGGGLGWTEINIVISLP